MSNENAKSYRNLNFQLMQLYWLNILSNFLERERKQDLKKKVVYKK